MLKKLILAVIGAAMGGLIGLIISFLGAGNMAIVVGAILGGLAFFFVVPGIAGPRDRTGVRR